MEVGARHGTHPPDAEDQRGDDEEVKQQIVANYPQMVQAALTQYLAGQMGQIGVAIQNTQNLSMQVGSTMHQLTSKLQQHGINLNT